jgi:hypothetical protein
MGYEYTYGYERDSYTDEIFRVMARVLGFAIAVIIVAYVLEYLGLVKKDSFVKTLIDASLLASIVR